MPGGVAARSAGWGLQRNLPGPLLPAGAAAETAPFPQTPLPIAVDLFMFGNWVDVTRLNTGQAGVYARAGITISRGRSSEGTTVDPTEISLTLNNRDGRYSPRNPTSILYGQIGRNTPLRVRVGNDVRAVGEVASWPAKWDLTGSDVWVPVQAAGILRRLGQGETPLQSVLRRSALSVLPNVLAYWPIEELSGSTSVASALPGGKPMAVFGTPNFGATDTIPASAPFADLQAAKLRATIPAYVSTSGDTTMRFVLSTDGPLVNGSVLMRVGTTGGTLGRFDVVYTTPGGGSLAIKSYNTAGTLISDTGAFDVNLDSGNFWAFMALTPGVGDVEPLVGLYPIGGDILDVEGVFDIIPGHTAGTVAYIEFGPNFNAVGASVAHLTVQDYLSVGLFDEDQLTIANAHAGETAGDRIFRLCGEEDIEYRRVDPSHTSTAMGAQHVDTLINLLQECAEADMGVLFEPRDFLGLAFVDRQAFYNRQPSITLDYAAHQMSGLEPVDDDRLTRNDVTVERVDGSSARQVLETGALSIQAPPDGVGRYDEQVTVNVETDAQLPDQAGWRLHLSTVDEARYPTIEMNLANPAFTSNAALTAQARALDLGQRLDVTNPPAWLPPDDITQAVQGLEEELGPYQWTIKANLVPDSPWQVAVYDDTAYRYSSDGSTLAAAVDSAAVSLSVSTPDGPLWTTDAGDVPFDLRLAGERITVTAISGATSPQTFTVTRAVNGVTKPQTVDTVVELWQPATYAL